MKEIAALLVVLMITACVPVPPQSVDECRRDCHRKGLQAETFKVDDRGRLKCTCSTHEFKPSDSPVEPDDIGAGIIESWEVR